VGPSTGAPEDTSDDPATPAPEASASETTAAETSGRTTPSSEPGVNCREAK